MLENPRGIKVTFLNIGKMHVSYLAVVKMQTIFYFLSERFRLQITILESVFFIIIIV